MSLNGAGAAFVMIGYLSCLSEKDVSNHTIVPGLSKLSGNVANLQEWQEEETSEFMSICITNHRKAGTF